MPRKRPVYRPSLSPLSNGERPYIYKPPARTEAESHLYTEMKPEKFLNLAVGSQSVYKSFISSPKEDTSSCRVLIFKIKKKQPLDLPNLWVSADCKVLAHEGRHRATAAKVCGIKTLPVLIHCRDEVTLEPTHWSKCFKCQRKRLKPQTTWENQPIAYKERHYGVY